MLIKQETFLDILGIPNTQFIVPVYQRVFSWTNRHCTTLWDDIIRAGKTGKNHFTGVLLFANDPQMWDGYGRMRIVDGQQRTTAVTLLLIALERQLTEGRATIEGVEPGMITRTYLKASADEDAPVKLSLAHLDCGTLATLIDNGEMPEEHSERLVECLNLFLEKMSENDFDANLLWKGLGSMQVISALLDKSDKPQLVFESLNAKGMPLTAGDLVRNAVIFGTENEDRMALYDKYWHPLEEAIADVTGADLDSLVRGWLSYKFQEHIVRNESDAYTLLRSYLKADMEPIDSLLDDLRRFGLKYASDAEFRRKADKNAKDWLTDRPRMGSRKMFGN